MNTKVQPTHLARSALVYVRQSTLVQIQKNRESTLRQYDLAKRAEELGWGGEQVVVIDEDQGHSGATTHGRSGFARVMSEVALGHVGIVLAIEASRLARNNADWQRLIWFCSLTETLLGDQDGLYDPSLLDDRMVLGLKGTISELEWHTIRKRMHEAAVHKARRGELRIVLPAGLEWQGVDGVQISADRQVVDALRMVFDKFDEVGSARQVALWVLDQGMKLPRRDKAGMIRWIEPSSHAVYQILVQPSYAGAYVYGRRRTVRRIESDGSVRTQSRMVARSEWMVLIREHHQGLISWERFERIQKQLMANATKAGMNQPGPAREGTALLQGLAYCGRCGRRMGVAYRGDGRRCGQFVCRSQWNDRGTDFFCQVLGARQIEETVVRLFLHAVEPAGVEVALGALESLRQEQERVAGHWRQRIERAEYEAERARGRYEAVDATNRLVAGELERRWNEALTTAADVRREAEERLEQLTRQLSDFERERVRRMAHDVGRIWAAASTSPRDKKRLLRAAIERVVITSTERGIKVAVEWKGGEITEEEFARRRRGEPTRVTDVELVELVRRLAAEKLDDTQIARVLSRRGMRTATGLTFTKRRVQSIRACHEIPCGAPRSSSDEPLYTAEDAARELGVSSRTIHQWLRAGLIRGQQSMPGAPWRVVVDDETRRKLRGKDAPEGWVGLDEAARRLGVSKQSVATWVKTGKLQAVRVTCGRRTAWRICVNSTGLEKQTSIL
jgi:excisionase family DNA binding protein